MGTSTYCGVNARLKSVLNVKAVVAAFNQEKALLGAFSVITNLRMDLFGALASSWSRDPSPRSTSAGSPRGGPRQTRSYQGQPRGLHHRAGNVPSRSLKFYNTGEGPY